jgi:hypothetical protein
MGWAGKIGSKLWRMKGNSITKTAFLASGKFAMRGRSDVAKGMRGLGIIPFSAIGATVGGARGVVRGAWWATKKTAYSAVKRPMLTTVLGSAAIGLWGVTRGITESVRMTQPPRARPGRAAMPISGPGYNVWAGGLGRSGQFNLGATGDLTLSLRKTRHG